ncbi:hypothetical protein [Streptomyces sp. NPDC001642]
MPQLLLLDEAVVQDDPVGNGVGQLRVALQCGFEPVDELGVGFDQFE